jgi:hypothetical protein
MYTDEHKSIYTHFAVCCSDGGKEESANVDKRNFNVNPSFQEDENFQDSTSLSTLLR